jgi:hypothetical protein
MRAFAIVCVLAAAAPADKLEDAAQSLIDAGLSQWERGDLAGARASFAHARDVLPDKPNPHRLLAIADAKLGHCDEAVGEADRFLQLTTAEDRRRGEIEELRAACRPAPPKPATTASAKAASQKTAPAADASRPWQKFQRNTAIASLVIGAALLAVGAAMFAIDGKCTTNVPLQSCRDLYDTNGIGAAFASFGAGGIVASVPLFIVSY